MFDVLAAVLVTVVLGTLVGHLVHVWIHDPRAGSLYRAHMAHHLRHYPPGDLRSSGIYRSSGSQSGWLTFTPIVGAAIGSIAAGLYLAGVALPAIAVSSALAALLGWAHGYVHDAFHLRGHWLERAPGFARLRACHDLHHRHLGRNLGILFFGWDRVLNTFREPRS